MYACVRVALLLCGGLQCVYDRDDMMYMYQKKTFKGFAFFLKMSTDFLVVSDCTVQSYNKTLIWISSFEWLHPSKRVTNFKFGISDDKTNKSLTNLNM